MNEKAYLIYLDILGFKELATDIARKKGIESRKVREDFLNIIKESMEIMEEKGKIVGKNYGGKDDWLLVTDGLDKVFKIILEILSHNTMYKDHEKMPLEIAVGTAEFDKWARLEGEKLIIEEATIEFFTTYIVDYYRKWYKDHHNGQKVESTFVILTESAYQELEPLDKKICRRIEYQQNKKHVKFFVADVDRVQQRGRVFEFLEKIEHAGSKWYDRIDYVYVPPLEYQDIKRTLEEKRTVFITGTQEYGKTYTAVRLMWEYYNRGYEPRWIKGSEKDERIKVREKLQNIRAELKPGRIIYFEDPFGKTQYERREGLEREIGTIIDTANQVKDAYALVTSREEVFKEFEKEKLSAKKLKEFENKLNIKKPSYDYEKRKEILLKWTEGGNCKWFGSQGLRNLVLESMKDTKILPTPLSMKNFVIATTDIEKEDELREKIKEKSTETEKAFAKEIKNMTNDKILFLSFLFISRFFEVDFVRVAYQELVGELNLKDTWEFDRVLNWFKDDKIGVIDKYLEFSHPSYSKSLEYLLVEDGYVTQINERIISKLLLKLSEKDEAAWAVARVVVENFDRLPEDVRNKLLLKLSEKDRATWAVARVVVENFDRLPVDVRNLLLKLSEKDEAAGTVAKITAENFDKLPEDVRNKLLLKLSEKDEAAGTVAKITAENFDKLPENVRNKLLLKLSEKDKVAGTVAKIIVENFDKLPVDVSNLLLKLSEKDEAAWAVARVVVENFDRLPEDERNKLLLKVSEKDKVAGTVAKIIVENFDKLPVDVRNLLLKLSEKDEAAGTVAKIIVENFDRLPEDGRNKLLLKLSEKDKVAGAVAWTVAENFNKLPVDVRNLLLKLSEKDEAAGTVAKIIVENFDRLPEDGRNKLLLELSEKDKVAGAVAWTVAKNFNKLPVDVRNKTLLELSEKDEAAGTVAKIVVENFDRLPENVRNKILLELSEKDKVAGTVAKITAENFDRLPENVRNKILLELSEKDKVAGTVAWTVAKNFNKLPVDVRNKILLELSEKDEAAGAVAGIIAENLDKLPEDVRNLLLKLSEKDEATWVVVWTVAESFNKLPEDVRNKILLKLSEKDEAAGAVARIIAENLDKLPEDVRNLLHGL